MRPLVAVLVLVLFADQVSPEPYDDSPLCCQGGGECLGMPGREDPYCCSHVCDIPGLMHCCTDHWDDQGALAAPDCAGCRTASGACCCPGGEDGCKNLTEHDCSAQGGIWQPGELCGAGEQSCPMCACEFGEGECVWLRDYFCQAGERGGQLCDRECFFLLPDCEDCPAACGGEWPDPAVNCCRRCPGGQCLTGPGCDDPACCYNVCKTPGFQSCCTEVWDDGCSILAFEICEHLPTNDECFGSRSYEGAHLLPIPGSTESGSRFATENESDPGFCCHSDDPGATGVGTLWYRFVAPEGSEDEPSSVRLHTCNTTGGGGIDSLIQVFSVGDPDRGLCADGLTVCSVSKQDCAEGQRPCTLDEQAACESLIPIACSDDAEIQGDVCQNSGGTSFPHNSTVCVPELVPGRTYYVMLASKTWESQDRYKLTITADCVARGPFDLDLDGDIDLEDFAMFEVCMAGGCESHPCGVDFNRDGMEDVLDFAEWLEVFTGPPQPE